MKYVVYYDGGLYGKSLNTKAGKAFKDNVEKVLGVDNVIWVLADNGMTNIMSLPN